MARLPAGMLSMLYGSLFDQSTRCGAVAPRARRFTEGKSRSCGAVATTRSRVSRSPFADVSRRSCQRRAERRRRGCATLLRFCQRRALSGARFCDRKLRTLLIAPHDLPCFRAAGAVRRRSECLRALLPRRVGRRNCSLRNEARSGRPGITLTRRIRKKIRDARKHDRCLRSGVLNQIKLVFSPALPSARKVRQLRAAPRPILRGH